MKKLLMICGFVLGTITITHAQDGGRKMISPEERAKKSTERLAEKLSLSEAQKAKVLTLYTAQATAAQKERMAAQKDRTANREKYKAQMAANDVKINALLTADQQKTFAAMKEARKTKMNKTGDRKKREFKGDRMRSDSTRTKAVKTM